MSQVVVLPAFCRDNYSRLMVEHVSSVDQEKSLDPKGGAKTTDDNWKKVPGKVNESGTAKKLRANDSALTKDPVATKNPVSTTTPSESASAGEGKKSSVEDEYDNLDDSDKAPVFSLSRITTVEQLVGFYLMAAQIYGFQFGLSIFFAGIILLAKNKKKVAYILIGYGAICALFGFSAINLKAWLLEEKGEKSEHVKQQSYQQSQSNGVSN